MNRSVTIWKCVRIDKRWRYCKPVIGSNGKIKPHWVLINGIPEHHPEGNYYIHKYEGDKEVWKKAGANPSDAVKLAEYERTLRQAKAMGVPIKEEDPSYGLDVCVFGFLQEVKLSSAPRTYQLLEYSLKQFEQWNNLQNGSKLKNVASITRLDCLRFRQWLIDEHDNSARTAGNKLQRLSQFIKTVLKLPQGKGPITIKDAKIGVVHKEPEVYEDWELEKFFAKCTFKQRCLYKLALTSGLRESELMYLYWTDLDMENCSIKVTAKPEYGFLIKDHEERNVTVPYKTYRMLLDLYADGGAVMHRKGCKLVFPTAGGKPDRHMLRTMKRIAYRAKLNCGKCGSCVKTRGRECEKWYLHKLRASYGTELARMGYDLASIRQQLGHKPGSEATFRYLAPLHHEQVRKKGLEKLFKNL